MIKAQEEKIEPRRSKQDETSNIAVFRKKEITKRFLIAKERLEIK